MNNELILTKKELKKIMEVIKYASKEEYKPILKCVNFKDNKVVALDGHRMAVRYLNTTLDIDVNILSSDLKYVLKSITKDIKVIKIKFDTLNTVFDLMDKNNSILETININNVGGDYIDYESLGFDNIDTRASIEFNKSYSIKDIISYLKTLDRQGKTIKLTLTNKGLEIQQDISYIYRQIWGDKTYFNYKCNYDFENLGNFEIAVNFLYLKDMLQNYIKDSESILCFNTRVTPIKIENQYGYDVVLPVRYLKKNF